MSSAEEVAAPPAAAATYDFDLDFQRKILAMTLRDTTFALRTEGLVQPEYFQDDLDGVLVGVGLDYVRTFKKVPGDAATWKMVYTDAIAAKKIRKDQIRDGLERLKECLRVDISDMPFVSTKVVDFARNQAMSEAILKSVGYLDKGDFAKIEETMGKAHLVGAAEDLGEYDYWKEAENRRAERVALGSGLLKSDGITTGIKELDECLGEHGGWGRKELSLLMGAAKAGKSMGLAEFGKFASLAKFNVLYLTCEVSAKITSNRLDANISDMAMKLLKTNPFAVETAVKKARDSAGAFKIHEFASGVLTPNMLRKIIEKHRANGLNFDLIVSDYADIMAPNRRNDSQIENMRTIYVDLRGIAFDYNAAVLTATQTNREGAKAAVAKMTDVAEDFNKIRTADVVISINSTQDERDTGEARLYFAAMRNEESGFTLRIKQDRARMQFLKKVLGRE